MDQNRKIRSLFRKFRRYLLKVSCEKSTKNVNFWRKNEYLTYTHPFTKYYIDILMLAFSMCAGVSYQCTKILFKINIKEL